jgi:hypothetical protein
VLVVVVLEVVVVEELQVQLELAGLAAEAVQ